MDKVLVVLDVSKKGGIAYICPVTSMHLDQVGTDEFVEDLKQTHGIPNDAEWAVVDKVKIVGGL